MRDEVLGVTFGRNDGQHALVSIEPPDRVRVIGFVCNDGERLSGAIQKARQHRAVMDLATGDGKASGAAIFIDYGRNFTRAASA